MARRLIADGIEYESARAAAAALGLALATVSLRAKLQRGGWRWAGAAPVADPKPLRQSLRRPVRIGGVEYPTLQEAARATGISRVVLERRIAQNWPGYEQPNGRTRKCVRGTPRPVTIGGVEYRSRAAAAEALGITREEVTRRVHLEKPKPVSRKYKGVVAEGVFYGSLRAAARAHGVVPNTVRFRIVKGWPGWSWGPGNSLEE